MVQVKPFEDGHVVCGTGGPRIPADYILWQGIHVCAVTRRDGKDHIVRDLPVGHAAHYPCTVDLAVRRAEPSKDETAWLWRPLLESLQAPTTGAVRFEREIFSEHREVIILNCLDFMYGHCLLKLLNAARHLEDDRQFGLVVLIPPFLRWLVPDGVAEVWTVHLGLTQMLDYHPDLHRQISAECLRFDRIFLSEGYSHPGRFQIEDFTRVRPHVPSPGPPVVTFIWREDRLWLSKISRRLLRKLGTRGMRLQSQNRRIRRFFEAIRRDRPDVRCCVAGLGRTTGFPVWIDDRRVNGFSADTERATASLYARSRLVVGVHGSNMLLPSGLAGMTLELVPPDKWDCLATDILFEERDPRLAVFRYRFIPVAAGPAALAQIALSLLKQAHVLPGFFTEDQPGGRRK